MELLETIALLLGWRLDKRHDYCFYLLGLDGAKIHVREEGARLKFEGIKPAWPSGGFYSWEAYKVPRNQIKRTRISCAKDRGAFLIAKDLERRLISNYLPMYQTAKHTVNAELKKLEELSQVEALAKRLLKGRAYLSNKATEPTRRLCFSGGEVEINSYSRDMSFKLPNLSYDQGLKLAAYLHKNIIQ